MKNYIIIHHLTNILRSIELETKYTLFIKKEQQIIKKTRNRSYLIQTV